MNKYGDTLPYSYKYNGDKGFKPHLRRNQFTRMFITVLVIIALSTLVYLKYFYQRQSVSREVGGVLFTDVAPHSYSSSISKSNSQTDVWNDVIKFLGTLLDPNIVVPVMKMILDQVKEFILDKVFPVLEEIFPQKTLQNLSYGFYTLANKKDSFHEMCTDIFMPFLVDVLTIMDKYKWFSLTYISTTTNFIDGISNILEHYNLKSILTYMTDFISRLVSPIVGISSSDHKSVSRALYDFISRLFPNFKKISYLDLIELNSITIEENLPSYKKVKENFMELLKDIMAIKTKEAFVSNFSPSFSNMFKDKNNKKPVKEHNIHNGENM